MTNEEVIIEKAINGDQGAFTQLYDLYFDRIYRYIYFRIKRRAEAEDLTQEVFIKILNAISSYKIGGTPFAAWLFRIAHNHLIDFVRKEDKLQMKSLDEVVSVAGNEDPVTATEYSMEVEELSNAIDNLPAAQQEVIKLRFIAGLSIAEVAKIAGKSEGTVKALQFNGTLSLKKLLAGRLTWQTE